jgi:acetoin:2,6-dichlorophenolindophenol oxidoreductase subunit alpha
MSGPRVEDRRPSGSPTSAVMLALYETMLLIREVEERLRAEYAGRNIRGPIHLSIGQEGVAAGVLLAAQAADVCVSTHRNHAHYLAKGGNLEQMVHELYGLSTGCAGGAGGSMHLFDDAVGMWGSSAIVGGSVPLALGLGLAKKMDGEGGVAIAFSGDGGTDEGSFWEALNLAALLEIPVLFVVEQNELSTNTTFAARQAQRDLLRKAIAFGVPAERTDGDDALGVHGLASELLASVRRERRPRLLEAMTSRLCAHVGPAVSVDAPAGPYDDWGARVAREPLRRLRTRVERDAPEVFGRLPAMADAVKARVDEVFRVAKRAFDDVNAVAGLKAPPPPNPDRV